MVFTMSLFASNMAFGHIWEVEEVETFEADATAEKFPKGEYLVMDVQTDFTSGFALQFRNMEFMKNMGFNLKNDRDAYSFQNMVKEMFFDSETSMIVISGVPGREEPRDKEGKPLEGAARG